jgi:hypothetical protein
MESKLLIYLLVGVILIGILASVVVGAVLLLGGSGSGSGFKEVQTGNRFSCDVVVDTDLFTETDIVSAYCSKSSQTCRQSSFRLSGLFLWIKEEGQVTVEDSSGGVYAKEVYEVIDGDRATVNLQGCSNLDQHKIVVRTLSDTIGEKEIQDSRVVTLQ